MRLRYPLTLLCAGLLPAWDAKAMSVPEQQYQEAMRAKPDPVRGAHYFETCAGCHGALGGGTSNGEFPRIAGQHLPVLVRQLVAFRNGLRWDYRMENFADRHRLPDMQAIADVAAYVAGLEDPRPPGLGSGEWVARGARVFFRSCESCHGGSGEGDSTHAVPRLAGQHYEYLRRQIYDAVDGRRPGFPAFHVRLLARLDHDEIAGVADYLARIVPQPSAPGRADRASSAAAANVRYRRLSDGSIDHSSPLLLLDARGRILMRANDAEATPELLATVRSAVREDDGSR